MSDFTAIFIALEHKTNNIRYINYSFSNDYEVYPTNCKEDIQDLIQEIKKDADFCYNLDVIDVCEIMDINGNTLWNEGR